MGQLAGFRYRDIIKRLKQLGFKFDRQAAGRHEIWYKPKAISNFNCFSPALDIIM
ncbi:MAG: type II toxin-antitoxin system HicA family toxin [Gammaproteobacteria bacterium]